MFSWNDYLDLARELASDATECRQRSAISRAYYSAYCSARNRVQQTEGISPPPGDSHKWLWDRLTMDADMKRKTIGIHANNLKEDRRKADYDDTFEGDVAKTAQQAIARATTVLNLLASPDGTPED